MQTIKYFIYARKSTEGEDRQVTSIEDQISETQKMARELNLEVVDIISESKSAKEPGRIEFNKMLKRIQKGEAQGILTWKLNRLARNSVDGGNIIHLLQKKIIKHVQTYGRGYLPTDNVLMMYVEFGMANQFSLDLSVDVKRGMSKKAERGWMPLPRLPIGYIHNTDRLLEGNKKEIIKDPKMYAIVKNLWKLFLEQEHAITGLKEIGDQMGLKTRKGNFFALSSYYRMFQNEFYCGYFYWKDVDGNSIRIKGKHKAMISLKEFEKAQSILNNRRVRNSKFKQEHIYLSLFQCGECNCSITVETIKRAYCLNCKCQFSIKNKDHCPKCDTTISVKKQFTFLHKTYYRCTKKRGYCSQKYILESSIEEQLHQIFDKIDIHKNFYHWGLLALEQINIMNTENELEKKLNKQINTKEKRIQGYMNMRADGEINQEEYSSIKNILHVEIDALKTHLQKNKMIIIDWKKEFTEAFEFAVVLKKRYEEGRYKMKRSIIRQLGSNPKLKDQNLYFPTPKSLLCLQRCQQVYDNEKKRLEPKKSLEKLNCFNDLNHPFSVLWAEVESTRTNYKIDNLNCQINNNGYQNEA